MFKAGLLSPFSAQFVFLLYQVHWLKKNPIYKEKKCCKQLSRSSDMSFVSATATPCSRIAQSQPHKCQASSICLEPKIICIYYWIDFPRYILEKIAGYSWQKICLINCCTPANMPCLRASTSTEAAPLNPGASSPTAQVTDLLWAVNNSNRSIRSKTAEPIHFTATHSPAALSRGLQLHAVQWGISAPPATGAEGTHWPLCKPPGAPQPCTPNSWKPNCSSKHWLWSFVAPKHHFLGSCSFNRWAEAAEPTEQFWFLYLRYLEISGPISNQKSHTKIQKEGLAKQEQLTQRGLLHSGRFSTARTASNMREKKLKLRRV